MLWKRGEKIRRKQQKNETDTIVTNQRSTTQQWPASRPFRVRVRVTVKEGRGFRFSLFSLLALQSLRRHRHHRQPSSWPTRRAPCVPASSWPTACLPANNLWVMPSSHFISPSLRGYVMLLLFSSKPLSKSDNRVFVYRLADHWCPPPRPCQCIQGESRELSYTLLLSPSNCCNLEGFSRHLDFYLHTIATNEELNI